jgi:hypothetical protein
MYVYYRYSCGLLLRVYRLFRVSSSHHHALWKWVEDHVTSGEENEGGHQPFSHPPSVLLYWDYATLLSFVRGSVWLQSRDMRSNWSTKIELKEKNVKELCIIRRLGDLYYEAKSAVKKDTDECQARDFLIKNCQISVSNELCRIWEGFPPSFINKWSSINE